MTQAPEREPARPALEPSILGYEIVDVLGRGGMGIVYKARETESGEPVAIKMIRRGLVASYEELVRFRVEAEALACVHHPNIIELQQVGVYRGLPYLVLELIEGESLAARMNRQRQPPRWSAELMRTLALAMHHAHSRSILHRDLKPSNVLLAADGTAKITDFGLGKFAAPMCAVRDLYATVHCKTLDEVLQERKKEEQAVPAMIREALQESLPQDGLGSVDPKAVTRIQDFVMTAATQLDERPAAWDDLPLTAEGDVMGTPPYMAPEQAAGYLNVGRAADIYSLGAVLYELLTGRRKEPAVVCSRPTRPREIDATISRELEAICLKCLEEGPENRYATAAGLSEDLDRFLNGYAVSAPCEPAKAPTNIVSNRAEEPRTRSWWPWKVGNSRK